MDESTRQDTGSRTFYLNGPLIWQLRTQKFGSREQFIEEIEKNGFTLSMRALGDIERGRHPTYASTAHTIAKVLGVSFESLLLDQRGSTPALSPGVGDGVVDSRAFRNSDRRLSGEVFAIELLSRPIQITRDARGHTTVTVDRNGVSEVVISNLGKRRTVERYVTPGNFNALLKRDREVQAFLAGGEATTETINLKELGIPLRWASGGVLSIVTDADEKQWVPLFFRDIPPYGWNISLGSPERWFADDGRLKPHHTLEAELLQPEQYILREFLEESLIVSGKPRHGETLALKAFHFNRNDLPIQFSRAKRFDEEHLRLRKSEDYLAITSDEATRPVADVEYSLPRCSLVVRFGQDDAAETNNVLVCFSLLDLGIEVIKVVNYRIGRDDEMLDGEIMEKHHAGTGTTEKELIRMPIALMSLDYLRATFGRDQEWHRYTSGQQPSIEVSRAPDPAKDEVRLFNWDFKRRMEAVDGKWGTQAQQERFKGWYNRFRTHFKKTHEGHEASWEVDASNTSCLFIPATAKALNLYFNMPMATASAGPSTVGVPQAGVSTISGSGSVPREENP